VNRKADFFYKTNRFESIRITNRIDSNRELECSTAVISPELSLYRHDHAKANSIYEVVLTQYTPHLHSAWMSWINYTIDNTTTRFAGQCVRGCEPPPATTSTLLNAVTYLLFAHLLPTALWDLLSLAIAADAAAVVNSDANRSNDRRCPSVDVLTAAVGDGSCVSVIVQRCQNPLKGSCC